MVIHIASPPEEKSLKSVSKPTDQKSTKSADTIDENSRLGFGIGVLSALGFIFIAASLIYAFWSETGAKEVFDACKVIIPSLATLVISFYFPNRK
jgi:hypothetical protein